ncbi:hypothetical protein CJF31_00002686 [Rutstroemia sp. NJR-2017a BVV2]|nr:hypothetical protein CJF31_00002686 [Rutstroemia sp. NJR-2017a BVV2]
MTSKKKKKKKSILTSASSRIPLSTPPIQNSIEESKRETNGKLSYLTMANIQINHIITLTSDLPDHLTPETPAQNLTPLPVRLQGPISAVSPIQGPIIEVEENDGEKSSWSSDSGSESEAFMDDDMDFLPIGWGKNKTDGEEDKERAEIARKGKLKKMKGQKALSVGSKSPACPILTKRNPAVSILEKSTYRSSAKSEYSVNMPQITTRTSPSIRTICQHATAEGNRQEVSREESATVIEKVVPASKTSTLSLHTTSILEQNASVMKAISAYQDTSSEKNAERFARQERDLKSAKSQAAALRAEIKLLEDKHRLELKRQVGELQQSHQKEMEALENAFTEKTIATEKMAMVLARAREKDSRVRLEKRKLEENMKIVTNQVEGLEETEEVSRRCMEILSYDLVSVRERLANALRSNEVLQADLAAEKSRNTSLSQQLSLLRVENRRVVDQQWSVSGSSRSIEREYNELYEDYYKLEDKYYKLKDEAAGDRSDRRRYKEDAEYYQGKLESVKGELKNVRDEFSRDKQKWKTDAMKLDDLECKYSILEKDNATLKPLAKIGADVRLRFLDQAREVALNVPREEIDVALRSNGNEAAHQGNGAADLALFEGGYIPESYEDEAKEIFETLYHPKDKYASLAPICKQYTDYGATLLAIKLTDSSSLQYRAYSNCCLEVNRRLKTSPENFRTSSEVADIVDKMEELTNEIVELERFRGGRRRRDTAVDYSTCWE